MDTKSEATSRENECDLESRLNETVPDDLSHSDVLPHSTPLHPTSPPSPSFRSTPSPTSSQTVRFPLRRQSGMETGEGERRETTNEKNPDKRKRRKWKKRRAQVHPVTDGAPHTVEEEHHPPTTLPPLDPPPHTSTGGVQIPTPSPLSPSPNRHLSNSLPPLLSSQVRKGGRRVSATTDWSSCGPAELERCLPLRQLRLFVGTWNMQHMATLPDSLDDFLLPGSEEVVPELYVVGTQETTGQLREWEVLLQQTLGPSHLLLSSVSLGELSLILFLRRDLLWFCSEVQSAGYSTRPGSAVKTKGGVGLSFSLFGTTFLFISSHFTAHKAKVEERNTDMQRIAANLTKNKLSEFDYVFWLGDLNYRLDMEREEVDQHISHCQQQQEQQQLGDQPPQNGWLPLLLHDQLTKEMLNGHVFQKFSEQPITFPPSYKFDSNSDVYDSTPTQRVPSWTDRVLFRSRAGSGIRGCGYNLCQSLRCSDHRPVYAMFGVRLEPCSGSDGVPDTMADFNRDVYRIAQQRRREVANLSLSLREGVDSGPAPTHRTTPHVTSSFCSIL